MRISIIPANEMPPDLVERWSDLQRSTPELCSPCFRPEFAQAIAQARSDTSVAIIDDGAALFPFHREWFGTGRPIAGRLSDYHGLIAPTGFQFDAAQLLRASGLQLWDFDHVPAAQEGFQPWAIKHAESPQIDLRKPDAGGSSKLREQASNRRRKLEREIGPVELEFHSIDPEMLAQCWRWKSEQYARTGLTDIMAIPWIHNLLNSIAEQDSHQFAGILSVLRAGNRPVAIHFGMRSGDVLHYWFPTYDADLAIYSPGTLLLLAILEAAPGQGISLVDLGKGDAFYKSRISNASAPLLEGCVIAGGAASAFRQSRDAIRSFVRATPLRQPVEKLVRRLRGR